MCSTEEARSVQHRVSLRGPVRQDSHCGDVVHAVRSYMVLLVANKPLEGEPTPKRVVCYPSGLIAGRRRYGGLFVQPTAQCRWGELALVLVDHRGEKGLGAPEELCQVHLRRLLCRCINTDVQVRYPLQRRGNHISG